MSRVKGQGEQAVQQLEIRHSRGAVFSRQHQPNRSLRQWQGIMTHSLEELTGRRLVRFSAQVARQWAAGKAGPKSLQGEV